MSNELYALGESLVKALASAGLTVATAESCTGGWVAKLLTDIPGSSAVFGTGIVSYSNEAKQSILGVAAETLDAHGAVSEAVVVEMAAGVLEISSADIAVAVSGIAGPDGGSTDKPVGTVWFAWADGEMVATECERFDGDRNAVREQSVAFALDGILGRLP